MIRWIWQRWREPCRCVVKLRWAVEFEVKSELSSVPSLSIALPPAACPLFRASLLISGGKRFLNMLQGIVDANVRSA